MPQVPGFLLFVCMAVLVGAGSAQAQLANAVLWRSDTRPWPRQYTVDGTQFTLYRPELDNWSENQLKARAVMAVRTGNTADPYRYGVAWLKARIETDKQGRLATFNDLVVTKVNFPGRKGQEGRYRSMLQSVAVGKSMVVDLDLLESALAFSVRQPARQVQVDNTPPEIVFSFTPAVLLHVDGDPVWRPSGVTGVEKAVNTRALLLRYQGRYYTGYADHWASSRAIKTGWVPAGDVPPPLLRVMAAAEEANQAPSRTELPANLAAAFDGGKFPAVYVRTRPAELISVSGPPKFSAIPGTDLNYVDNTAADIFIDGSAVHNWYVLVSGRWFRAPSSKGPWRYVAPKALPPGFARIPQQSPKSAVLASVAGTPQAREAIVASAIPQTATVDRAAISFYAQYDGEPRFRPLPGTKNLFYAVNAEVPVIDVRGRSYYALADGIWFASEASPEGPWMVATSVPEDVYSIPSSSPLHFVTYARVYGGDGRYVHVGYTPGYYGTAVSNDVVVYGTGYSCAGWVGKSWHGCPETYGYGAALAEGAAVGWGVAFGWGWDYPWHNPGWGPWEGNYPGYYPWAYGSASAWNAFGRWGGDAVAETRAAWSNPWTGRGGHAGAGRFYNPYTGRRGYGYAGRNGNIYAGRIPADDIRYDPRTGRVVLEECEAMANIDRGELAAGRAARDEYDRYSYLIAATHRQAVAEINGNMYAGRDGNVYREGPDGWERLGADNRFSPSRPASGLENERKALEKAVDRERAVDTFERHGGFMAGGDGRIAINIAAARSSPIRAR